MSPELTSSLPPTIPCLQPCLPGEDRCWGTARASVHPQRCPSSCSADSTSCLASLGCVVSSLSAPSHLQILKGSVPRKHLPLFLVNCFPFHSGFGLFLRTWVSSKEICSSGYLTIRGKAMWPETLDQWGRGGWSLQPRLD